jgi:hypothetical protein
VEFQIIGIKPPFGPGDLVETGKKWICTGDIVVFDRLKPGHYLLRHSSFDEASRDGNACFRVERGDKPGEPKLVYIENTLLRVSPSNYNRGSTPLYWVILVLAIAAIVFGLWAVFIAPRKA